MSTKELIRKAARGRDVKLHGCLGFNRSADKLQEMGEQALPAIEAFLCDEMLVLPAAPDELPGMPWLGLADVLHVYFVLAARSRKVEAGQFLLSLHGWLREEAMRVVFSQWGPARGSHGKAIPAKLRKAVERLKLAGTETERDLARRLLQWQDRLTRPTRRMATTHH
jgi:hypothetical protein